MAARNDFAGARRFVIRFVSLSVVAAACGFAGPSLAQINVPAIDDTTLIPVRTAEQLHAIRWDLDANGEPVPAMASSASYRAAFGSISCAPNCTGYALDADIDLGASRWSRSSSTQGWQPIGGQYSGYGGHFDGRGHVITGLYINRPTSDHVGLFARIGRSVGLPGSERGFRNLGFLDVDVTGNNRVGTLAGRISTRTTVTTIYVADGSVTGNDEVGGLVGWLNDSLLAVYASVSVSGRNDVGGLAGLWGGEPFVREMNASYAAGRVTGTSNVGGLVGRGTVTIYTVDASYWDTLASGRDASAVGVGTDTASLQMPTTYSGIYANWDVNVDGVAGNDDPWDFGTSMEYPALQASSFSVARQRGVAATETPVVLTGPPVIFASSTYSVAESTDSVVMMVAVRLSDEALGAGDFSVTGTVAALDGGTMLTLPGGGVSLHYDLSTSPVAFRLDQAATRASVEIPVVADEIPENEETLSLRLLSFGYPASAQTATAVITDDDGITVGFENTSFTIAEGATLSVCVAMTMPTSATPVEREFSVDVASDPGSAGTLDFSAVSRRLTFGSATRDVCFAFEPTDDDAAEGDEEMFLTLDRPSGGSLGDDRAAVTITDNDPIIIGFASTAVAVVEGASALAEVCVEISDPATIERPPFTLSLRTTDGSALAGSDYTPPSPTTIGTFQQSSRRLCRNVALINDDVVESTETFSVSLGFVSETSPIERVIINTDSNTLTVTIADDDVAGEGTVIFVRTAEQLHAMRWDLDGDGVPVAAMASSASWHAAFPSVSCAPMCTGYALDADVDLGASRWSSSSSTAGWQPIGTESDNFVANFDGRGHVIENLFINRPTSDHVGLFGYFGYKTSDDHREEDTPGIRNVGIEDADVTGGNQVGALVGLISTGTVAAIYVRGGSVSGASEVGGLAGALADIGAAEVRASYAAVRVRGSSAGGLVGRNYGSSVEKITASYAAGRVTGTTMAGGLVGQSGLAASGGQNFRDSYWDTEASGQAASAGTGAIGTDTASLQTPTTYSGIYANWNIDVDGSTMTGAGGNDDPWDFGTAMEYPALQASGFSVARQRGAAATATPVVLTGPPVVFASSTYSATESTGAMVMVTVRLSDEAQRISDFSVTGTVTALDGGTLLMITASERSFHYDLSTSPVVFSLDAAGAMQADVTIPVINDAIPEEAEIIPLQLVSSGYSESTQTAAAMIEDDDPVMLGFERPSYSIDEDGREISVCVAVTVPLDTEAMQRAPLLLNAQTRPGTSGTNDFNSINQPVGPFSLTTRRRCLAIEIRNDAIREDRESFFVDLTLQGDTPERVTINPAVTEIAIEDDDEITIGFEQSALTVTEGIDSSASVCIAIAPLGAGGAVERSDFNLLLSTTDGSAVADEDYVSSDTVVGPFGSVNSRLCHDVALIDDDVAEGAETFSVSLSFVSETSPPERVTISPNTNTLTVTIVDDDATAIFVTTATQLHAMRWDPDGDGVPVAAMASSASWHAAFPSVPCAPNCAGYALGADIDLGASRWSRSSSTEGWQPIGTESDNFVADFDGRGYVIQNLFINRPTSDHVGLFGYFGYKTSDDHTAEDIPSIRNVGIEDADVTGRNQVGALAGFVSTGTVVVSYVREGSVSGTEAGGLVGALADPSGATIRASYATVGVRGASAGGLVGRNYGSHVEKITTSYAAGRVTGTTMVGGLVGQSGAASGGQNFRDSYWDIEASGQAASAGTGAIGTDTASLQMPTTYSGIYANWNIDVDGSTMTGAGGNDDPWDFGTSTQHPVLKYGGFSVVRQRGGMVVPPVAPPPVTPPPVTPPVTPPPAGPSDTEPPQFVFGDEAVAFAPGSSRLWLPLSEEVKVLSERENARNSTASASLGAGTEFEGFVVILNLQSSIDPCGDLSGAMTIGVARAYYDAAPAVVLELARPLASDEDNVWVGYCYQAGAANPGLYDLALEQGAAAPGAGRNLLRSALGRMTRDLTRDSDGDGLADALETRLGSNPLSADGVPDDVPVVTLARGVATPAHMAYSGVRANGVLEHLGVAVTPAAARLQAYYLSDTFGYSSGGEAVTYGCDGSFPSNYDAPLSAGGCATVDFGSVRAGVDHVIGWLATNEAGYRFTTTATASGLPQQMVRRVAELNMASQRLYTRGAGGGVAVEAMQDGPATANARLHVMVTTAAGVKTVRVPLLTSAGRIAVEVADEASRYEIIGADTGDATPQLLWRPEDGLSGLTAGRYSLGPVTGTRVSLLPQAEPLLGPAELTRGAMMRADLRVGESGYSVRIAARAPADGTVEVVDVNRASTATGTGALEASWNAAAGYVETAAFGIAANATTATLALRVTLSSGDNDVEREYGWPILLANDDDGDGIENAVDDFGGVNALPVIVSGTMAGADLSHHARHVLPLHRLRVGEGVRTGVNARTLAGLALGYSDYAASSLENPSYAVVYDFEIHGVEIAAISTGGDVTGGVAGVIIPLPTSLYQAARLVPIKLPSGDAFDTSGQNDYGFAPLDDGGACPPDAGDNYRKAGDETIEKRARDACMVVYIVDGGPNDEDGAVNGIVDDPLALAVSRRPLPGGGGGTAPGGGTGTGTGAPPASGGHGGSFGLVGLLALLLLLTSTPLLQRRRTRR